MEPILDNLIKALGWSIFHSLWQGAVIYGILLLITLIFPRLKSGLKHNLAFAAICLIFICYGITFFSVFKLPVAVHVKDATNISLTAGYYQYMSSIPEQISNITERFFPFIVGFYSLGLLFQLLILGIGYKRMLDLKKAMHLEVPATWKASFEKLSMQLNLHQQIGFYLSDKINVPLVIGYFKPVVLFPIGLATQLDMDQVEAILIHELSHIRRNDYLLNLIKTGIQTILFFNPFIWLSGKFINIEREHACDDLVLKVTGNPMTYARALLNLEILKDKTTPVFSMAATGKNQHLYQRIKRITDMKTNYMNVRQQMFTITLTIATVVSLAWISPSKAEKATITVNQQNSVEVTSTNTVQVPAVIQAPKPPKPVGIPKPAISIPEPPTPPEPHTKAIPVPPLPPTAPKHITQDTTKKKTKYSIITVDEKGNKKVYQSVNDMPENLRNQMISETWNSNYNKAVNMNIDSIVSSSTAFLNSPEWKKSMSDITASADNLKNYFNSKDWQKQQEDIQKNAEKLNKYFKSKDWKKQEANIKRQAMELQKQTEKIQEQVSKGQNPVEEKKR